MQNYLDILDIDSLRRSQMLSLGLLVLGPLPVAILGQSSPAMAALLWIACLVSSFPPVALELVKTGSRLARLLKRLIVADRRKSP